MATTYVNLDVSKWKIKTKKLLQIEARVTKDVVSWGIQELLKIGLKLRTWVPLTMRVLSATLRKWDGRCRQK